MRKAFEVIPVLLYLLIGVICLLMAFKNLFSTEFLPYHEKAAGKEWGGIEDSLRLVILSFLRLAGLGFLVVSILMIVCPIVNYFAPNMLYKYLIPVVALIYSIGLFVINYLLYKGTKAETPWKGSIYAVLVILTGIVISILDQIFFLA